MNSSHLYLDDTSGYVFVYGTLKSLEQNAWVTQKAGSHTVASATISGFDLYDLVPEGYPGLIVGTGNVKGELLHYPDLEGAFKVLDILEGANETPPEYSKKQVTVQTDAGAVTAWVYLYNFSLERTGATLVSSGDWHGQLMPLRSLGD